MLSVSNTFIKNCKDLTKKKICYIIINLFETVFTNSDFTSSGVTVEDYFCTDDDLSYGQAPSSRLSFSIFGEGIPDGYPFESDYTGNPLQPMFGVETAETNYTFGSNVLSHIEIKNYTINDQTGDFENEVTLTIEGRTTGLYCNNTKIHNGVFNTLLSRTFGEVVAIGSGIEILVGFNGTAVGSISDNTGKGAYRFNQRKFANGASWAVIEDDPNLPVYQIKKNAIVWDKATGKKTTYEVVSMGLYDCEASNISKSFIGSIYTFSDLADILTRDDNSNYWQYTPDAINQYLSNNVSYPMTLTELCDTLYPMIPVMPQTERSTSTIKNRFNAIQFASNPLEGISFTFRQLIQWIGEATRTNCLIDRRYPSPQCTPAWIGTSVEHLDPSDIGIDSVYLAYKETHTVDRVWVENTEGESRGESVYERGDIGSPNMNTYFVSNNPIVAAGVLNADSGIDADQYFLDFMVDIPTYLPCSFKVLEANPAIEVGDMIDAYDAVFQDAGAFAINDNGTIRVIASSSAVAYGFRKSPNLVFPLMHRKIVFNGVSFTADYEATGNVYRTE